MTKVVYRQDFKVKFIYNEKIKHMKTTLFEIYETPLSYITH